MIVSAWSAVMFAGVSAGASPATGFAHSSPVQGSPGARVSASPATGFAQSSPVQGSPGARVSDAVESGWANAVAAPNPVMRPTASTPPTMARRQPPRALPVCDVIDPSALDHLLPDPSGDLPPAGA